MKIFLNTISPRKTIMPIIAATMISSSVAASSSKVSKEPVKQASVEYFNKQAFENADINKDHALSYTEFISVPKKCNSDKETKHITNNSKAPTKKYYLGLLLFSFLIAGFDIISSSIKSEK